MLSIPALVTITACFSFPGSSDTTEPLPEGHWGQFRGVNGDGIAVPDNWKLPVHFGPDKNVRWKILFASGLSSPCLNEAGRIVLTGFDKPNKKLETICIDRHDGKVLWRQPAPADKIERFYRISSPATATPAARRYQGKSVVYFGSYGLLCYDHDGKELWRHTLPIPETRFGSGTSPIVFHNRVYLFVSGNPPSLLCIDINTGKSVWKKEQLRCGGGYATPIFRRVKEIKKNTDKLSDKKPPVLDLSPTFLEFELIVFGERGVAAYDLKDGAERWWVGGILASAIPTPVLNKEHSLLYVVSQLPGGDPDDRMKLPSYDDLLKDNDKNKDGVLAMDEVPRKLVIYSRGSKDSAGDITLGNVIGNVDINRDGKISRLEWLAANAMAATIMHNYLICIRPDGKGDISRTNVVWKEKMSLPEVPSPLYYQDNIYFVRNGGLLTCCDAKTGKVRYQERLGAPGQYYASPVLGDGKLYLASADGVVVVVKAGNKFEILAKNDLGESIMATPALHEGTIYVRTEGHLYGFAEGKKK